MAAGSGARVAVLVRTHTMSDKVLDLVEGLSGGRFYDFYLTPNAMHELDAGALPSVPHSLEHCNALGFEGGDEYFLLHCADLLFAVIREQIPGYDFYVMVEYDVHFIRTGHLFMDRVAQGLSAPPYADVDLVGAEVTPHDPSWMWTANVAPYFPEVWGVFFPFVALSSRAITRLLELRREERRRTGRSHAARSASPDNLMYCEAFVASALKADGFRLLDLQALVPGCYSHPLFTVGPPKLLGEALTDDPAIEIVHPVLGPREYLERRLREAQRDNTLLDFLAELRRLQARIAKPLRAEFEGRLRAIAEGRA